MQNIVTFSRYHRSTSLGFRRNTGTPPAISAIIRCQPRDRIAKVACLEYKRQTIFKAYTQGLYPTLALKSGGAFFLTGRLPNSFSISAQSRRKMERQEQTALSHQFVEPESASDHSEARPSHDNPAESRRVPGVRSDRVFGEGGGQR